jgi:hypothetical protein
MSLFQKTQFEELAAVKSEYCISVYIPTQRVGENKESRLMLKNQVSSIEKQLTGYGLKKVETDEYLNPLRKILDDTSIWRLLSDTMVIFRNREKFIIRNLPLRTKEFSLVSDHFYMLPLLDIFNQDKSYFIFLISLNKNKLYQANQNEFVEIVTEDIFPQYILDSAGEDVVQKSQQMRGEQSGSDFALYHGKGEGKDDKENERNKYLRDLNRELTDLLEGYNIPLVVASVEDLFFHFKDLADYKNLYSKCVAGNWDNDDILLIHEKANELLKPYFDEVKNEKKAKYIEAPDDIIISNTEDVVKASYMGQVETLFVEDGRVLWGDYNEETGEVSIREDKKPIDSSLLDYTARLVFLKGGNVFIEDIGNMPESGSPMNAVLRFQI